MSDLIEFIYRLRNMADLQAEILRKEIKEAQAMLDRLDKFASESETGAELLAASDLYPNSYANIPKASGLVRRKGENK